MARGRTLTVSEIVGRVRLSFPLMKAASVDTVLRQMLISELLSQVEREGGAVVLPMHLRVHTVDDERFREYKNQLSGLTMENVDEVREKIAAMGLYTGPAVVAEPAAASVGVLGGVGQQVAAPQQTVAPTGSAASQAASVA